MNQGESNEPRGVIAGMPPSPTLAVGSLSHGMIAAEEDLLEKRRANRPVDALHTSIDSRCHLTSQSNNLHYSTFLLSGVNTPR